MSLVGANKGVAGVVTNGADNESDTELQRMMNLEKLSASILYENILDGVDLEYIAYSMNIKDNIIVKEKKNEYTYAFELKLNNLWARREANGDISIFEGKGESTDPLKYIIPAPVIYDANGEYAPADKAQYFLTHNNGGKYTLTVIVDSEWVNAEERAFPVVVDPEVVTKAADAVDAWIYLDYGEAYKRMSSTYGLSQCERLYWVNELSSIPEGVYVSSAIWDFEYSNYTSQEVYVKAYKVTSSWAEYEQFCYYDYTNSNIGTYDSDVLDMVTLPDNTNLRVGLNITEAVNDWIAGEDNYGIMLAGENCDCGNPITVKGCVNTSPPKLTIQYVLQTGLENYWSYSSHSIGGVATGRVNLATGDLSLVIPTLTSTPELFKYTPTLIYNSAFYDTEINSSSTNSPYASSSLPRGFKLSTDVTVVRKEYVNEEGITKPYYIYCDADGTEHAFYEFTPESSAETEHIGYESKYYADEDGLQKVLEIRTYENATDNKLLIYDDSKQVSEFTKINQNSTEVGEAWKIKYIYDISGNIISFVYNPSNENQLTNIYLIPVVGNSDIELLGFYYNAHGKLTYIFEPNGQKAIKLLYTDDGINVLESATKYLSQIQYLYVDSSAEIDYEDWDAHLDGRQNNTNIQAMDLMYIQYKTNSSNAGQIDFVMDALVDEMYTYTWGLFSPAINHSVSSVKQSVVNAEGQTTGFFYSTLHTEVISSGADDIYDTSDDLVTRYVFDNRGRAISVYSHSVNDMTILGASYGEYEEQDNVKNNLKEQAVLGGNPVNKFYYGTCSFLNSNLYPYIGNVTCVEGPGCEDGDKCWKFNPTPENSVARLYHCVYLPAGTYTFSMETYSKNAGRANGSFEVRNHYSTNTCYMSEVIPLNGTSTLVGPNLFACTFTLETSATVEIYLDFSLWSNSPAAEIYVDNIMLEKGIGVSKPSVVRFGDFEGCLTYVLDGYEMYDEPYVFWYADNPNAGYSLVSGGSTTSGKCIQLNGAYSTNTVTQSVYDVSTSLLNTYLTDESHPGNANKSYTVSAFAKAVNAVASGKFRLFVNITYYQGQGLSDVVISHYYDLQPSINGWQYVGGEFDLAYIPQDDSDTNSYKCVKNITVGVEFSGQINTAYAQFDDISVVETNNGNKTKYEYYENGLVKSKQTQYYLEYYYYDDSRNLIRQANNKGEIVDYTYYENSDLVESISKYNFTNGTTTEYPDLGIAEADALIIKNQTSKTIYTYNTLGLVWAEEIFAYNSNGELDTDAKSILNSYVYITSGVNIGALSIEIDSSGNQTKYFYDNSGNLKSTVKTENNSQVAYGLYYEYDYLDRLIDVSVAKFVFTETPYKDTTHGEGVEYTYTDNRLSTVTTPTCTYSLIYDSFGNGTFIKVGNTTLVGYEYNDNNGKLNKVIYSNGQTIRYVYNTLEKVSEIWYTINDEEIKAYSYIYTSHGQIHSVEDHINLISTVYTYDTQGRIMGVTTCPLGSSIDTAIKYSYNDDDGSLTNIEYSIKGAESGFASINNSFMYNTDGSLDEYLVSSNGIDSSIQYEYDAFDRIVNKNWNNATDSSTSFDNDIAFTYEASEFNTTTRIKTYTSVIGGVELEYTFTYDHNDNITRVVYSTGEEIRYYYDDLSQLIREDNGPINITYVYAYDNAGNITSKYAYQLTYSETINTNLLDSMSYGYEDTTFGDMLTCFMSNYISYDAIGNPLSYYNGFNFTWQGRELVGATRGNNSYTFAYNDEGNRISKTVNGVKTSYAYDGYMLISEYGSDYTIIYLYDAEGGVIGMRYRASSYATGVWDTYWYEKNIFGDIVAVYDNNGTKLISYTYDAWGKFSTRYHNGGANTTAVKNPFKYRGYYYDKDLDFYYLRTRYYDFITCRFISPDNADLITASPTALTDKNLYAYCDNNPVMRRDYSGYFWDTVFDVGSLIFSVGDVIANPCDPWAWLGLIGDAVDLIPFVSGVGETTKLIKIANKVDFIADTVDDVVDVAKVVDHGVSVGGAILSKSDVFDGAIDTYSNLRKIAKGSGNEVHHIIEKRFIRSIPSLGSASDMGSVILDRNMHRQFTNAWRSALPYGGYYTRTEILNAGMRIYAGYPSLQRYLRFILGD